MLNPQSSGVSDRPGQHRRDFLQFRRQTIACTKPRPCQTELLGRLGDQAVPGRFSILRSIRDQYAGEISMRRAKSFNGIPASSRFCLMKSPNTMDGFDGNLVTVKNIELAYSPSTILSTRNPLKIGGYRYSLREPCPEIN